MCKVKVACGEVAQENAMEDLTLLLQQKHRNKTVLIYFWVDNLDLLVDRQAGGGSVNTTHLVAFQNRCKDAVVIKNLISIERKKCRTIPIDTKEKLPSTFTLKQSSTD